MKNDGPYSPDAKSVGRRVLKNVCLDLLAVTKIVSAIARALANTPAPTNMTDRMAALETLSLHDRAGACRPRSTISTGAMPTIR